MPTPLTDERVTTAVGKVQVQRGGAGSPVVYLHSALGEAAGLALLEDLADDHDAVAPLFPGFGESEGIEQIEDMEDAVFHVLDVFDQLDLDAPAVIGLSLGGWMAAEVATRYPERVSALVLVNAVGLYLPEAPVPDIFGKTPSELAGMMFADQSHPVAQMMNALAARLDEPSGWGDLPFELFAPTLKSMAATAKLGWDPYLHDPKLRKRLHRVTAPTLVVHGEQDAFVVRGHSEAYADGIPGARIVDLPGGHLLPLEQPERLAAAVREFVAT